MLTHEHDVFDKDKHFIIDQNTRKIINQSEKKTLVKTDHNSEIYTFEMPRCIEGHDMTLCNVNEVHYINLGAGQDKGKTSSGLYQIEDLQVSSEDNEKVVFSWVVKGNATKYEGSLQFKIKFKCVNNNAEITYLGNTVRNKELTVGEDINNTDYVEEMYADVLAQWEQRFIEAGAVDLSSYYTKDEVDHQIDQLNESIANGSGKGWTSTQIGLLETLLKNVAYQDEATGQSIAKSLIASLRENTSSDDNGSGDSGSEDSGDDTTTEKTLSSISVVYTGGEVTVGTDVNSLSGIVVTATYSDETFENVNGYELSGEIIEGTNVITVTYQGLTTTFEVVGYVESTDEEWVVVQEIGENYESGGLDLATGEVTENTSWYVSSFIEVPSGATSFSRITSRESDYSLVWYDETQTFIGKGLDATYSGSGQYGGGYTDEEGVLWNLVPSHAKYCKVSWRTNATYTSITFKHNLLLNENVEPIYNKVYYYTFDNSVTTPDILNDDYLNCEGMTYAQIRPVLRRGIYFYDENHSQISTITTANNIGNNVVIPSGAKYMRFHTPQTSSRYIYGKNALIEFTETELTTW